MKAVGCLVVLCLLAGCLGAEQYAWKVGKTYTYKAVGRLLAGISEINTQYSGLEIAYVVELTPIAADRLILKPFNVKVKEVNEEQDGGWRDVPVLKGVTEVELPTKIRMYIESSIEVKFNKGVVETIKVQGNLPNWAINIKKAQVSHFVLDTIGQNAVMTGNLNRDLPNQVRPEDVTTQSGVFYETMETTVLGQCKTYYTISEHGPFQNPRTDPLKAELQDTDNDSNSEENNETNQRSSSEESNENKNLKYAAYKTMIRRSGSNEDIGVLSPDIFHSFCDGKNRLMEITKTVNYSMCHEKPVLGYASPSIIMNSRAGDNSFGNALARVSYTRYIACGQGRKQYTILKIEQEEQIFQGILRKEKTVGGTVKNITLVNILPCGRIPPTPVHARLISDLTYTFSTREQKMRLDGQLKTPFENDEVNQNDPNSDSQESTEQNVNPRQRRAVQQDTESAEEQQMDAQGQRYATQWATAGAEGNALMPMPSMTEPPLNPMLASSLSREGMKTRVGVLLKEIVRDITDQKPMAEQETLSKIATVAKILRYLSYVDIEFLYTNFAAKQQTEEDKIQHKIFLDAVAMAGTNPNIKFLVDLMTVRKSIVGEEANQLIMTFPMFVRTPTVALLSYIWTHLVEFSPSPDNMDQFHTTAYLAFTNLLYDACVNTRIANTRYPVQLYGEFCPQSIPNLYIPHIVKQLKWALEQVKHDEHSVGAVHWVTVFLASLGNTGHPSIVEHIQLVLDNVGDSYIKTKATFALKRLITSRSAQNVPIQEPMATDRKNRDLLTDEIVEKKVLPVLLAAAFDRTEAKEVRMAAVALIVRATPPDSTIWQTLAYSTWFEPDQEVHSYIYNIIWSLSQLARPADPITWHAHLKARAVLPLMKPIKIGITRSRAFHEAAFFDEIQSGFMHHWSQFGSENSVWPNAFYYQNYKFYGGGAVADSPLELSAHGHTISHIVNHILGKFQSPTKSKIVGNEAIKCIADLLHIVDREQDETPQASLQVKLRAEMERIISVNRESIDVLVELLKKEYIPALLTGLPVNYQKALKLTETNYEFPTIFGIPIQVKTMTHSFFSLRGNVKFLGFKDLQINAELHPIISYKTHGFVAFKSPITGKAYQSGVQHHAVFEFPFRAMFRKSQVGTLEFAITPTHIKEGQIGGQIDIFTFHRRPYTVIVTDELWPISHKEGGQMKIVHAVEKPYRDQQEWGQKSLGLAFELIQETEYQPEEERYPGWSRFFRRFEGTWGGLMHHGIMGAKTLRLAERRLILDNVKSNTKTLYILIAGEYNHKIKHVVSEVSSEENRLQNSGESNQSESNEPDQQVRQVYDSRTGDFNSQMDKKLKQRQYSEYRQYKAQRQEQSNQQDSSSEESNEFHGQFYAQQPYENKASVEEEEQFHEIPQQYQQQYPQLSKEPRVDPKRHVRWLVVAVLGKATPLHAPLKIRGPQTHHETAPSVVQYLFSATKFPEIALLRVSAGEPTKEHASELAISCAAVEKIRKAINSTLTKGQKPFCGDYFGHWEFPFYANRHSLLTLRENLLRQDLTVPIKGEVSFGSTCHNKMYNVTYTGKLTRDEEMKEYAKSGSFQAKQCTEDEKKGFSSSPVCIVNSEQQAAALNVAEIEFRSTQLPLPVVNATVQFSEFVKAWLYKYMSYDPMPIRPLNNRIIDNNYLKVQAKLKPQIDYLTLKFFLPTKQVFFEDIELSHFAKAVFPITATQTLKENIRDRVFQTEASCSVEGNFVNTLDNVTYQFDPRAAANCKHVLVQDCSEKMAVSVVADNLGSSNLITTVLLPGDFRIELLPTLRQSETSETERAYVTANTNNLVVVGQGRVLVNGDPVKELPTTVFDEQGHFVAYIEEASGTSLQLFAEDVKVTTDGRHIVVYPSNNLRNYTCGLCGNFDVSKVIDFRSPKDCPLSTGTYMMAAYAFQQPWKKNQPGGNVCKVAEDVIKAIENEDRDCQTNKFVPVAAYAGSCKDELVSKIGDAVYTIVRNALKPVPGVNGKKWAEKARDKVKEVLKGEIRADQIAELIATAISKFIPYVGGIVKPAIKFAVQKVVDIVCKNSGCCDAVYYF